ncbi:MAG: AMP-binding protein [Rhizomicrobium sp.]
MTTANSRKTARCWAASNTNSSSPMAIRSSRGPFPRMNGTRLRSNYTSGTTGNPKGVVSHHRGATLMGYGNIIASKMPMHPVYLWTVPMFHCNGWCFPWSLSVVAGHACVPALGAREGDVRRACRSRRHASVRCADRDVDFAERAGT